MKQLRLRRETVRTLSDRHIARVRGGAIRQPGASDECPGTLDCPPTGGGAPTGRCDLAESLAINGC